MIVTSPIVSRLFTPEDIGILSVYVSILGIIAPFATLRFDLAIPIADDNEGAINLLVLSLISIAIVSAVILPFTTVFADPITAILNAQSLEPFLWLLSIGTIGTGFYTTFLHWAMRKKAYRSISKTKVNQGIAKVTVQILSGFLNFGPIGLILGEVFGQTFGIRVLSKPLLHEGKKLWRAVNLNSMKLIASRYKKFPLITSWSDLLNTAGFQIPVLILSAIYGPSAAGFFGFSNRIISLPLGIIGVAISQVFFSEGASLSKKDPNDLLKLTMKVAKRLFVVGVIVAAILIPFGPWLFTFVFGNTWREAGVYSQVLSIMLMIRFVVSPISQALSIMERQGTQFLLDLLRLVLVIVAFYISKLLGFNSLQAVTNYTVAMVIVYAFTYLVIIRALKRRVREFKNNE